MVRSGDLDQAGLHGVLDRIRDLGLDIVDVHLIADDRQPVVETLTTHQEKNA
ncbi:MAG: hypothetical protein WBL31_05110 [Ilumatobacteraceae bacterium]